MFNTLKSVTEVLKCFEQWQDHSRERSFEKFRNDFDDLDILILIFKIMPLFYIDTYLQVTATY